MTLILLLIAAGAAFTLGSISYNMRPMRQTRPVDNNLDEDIRRIKDLGR